MNRRLKGEAVRQWLLWLLLSDGILVRFSSACFFPFLYPTTWCLFFLQWGENEHRCCHLRPILFKCCCCPLLAMLLFALPLTAGSAESFLLPALGNHAHSLDLCVTHHGNKCVHSFEDCHDGACLSDFPPHIVRPSNHPPTPWALLLRMEL